jgi:hypothetical protein
MAKLKEGIQLQPFGPQCKTYSGEIPDSFVSVFIEKGLVTENDFEILPADMPKKTKKQSTKK